MQPLVGMGNYVIKLEPGVVARNFDTFGHYLEQALPTGGKKHPFQRGNLLAAILSGTYECWVLYSIEGRQSGISAVALTSIAGDPVLGSAELVIVALTAIRGIGMKAANEGMDYLREYARSKGCSAVTMRTELPSVGKMFKSLGGKLSLIGSIEV